MFLDENDFDFIDNGCHPEHPKIHLVTATCKIRPAACPYCGSDYKGHGQSISKPITHYNPKQQRVENIVVSCPRYICKSPACKKVFTPGALPNKLKYTQEFQEFVTRSLVKMDMDNFSSFGRDYGKSHTTIANILKKQLESYLLRFAPPYREGVFYLIPFQYEKKERFYLSYQDQEGKYMLLSFFGYKNAREEIKNYFQFHWHSDEYPYSHVEIVTDMDPELIDMLYPCFTYYHASIHPVLLKRWLDSFKNNHKSSFQKVRREAIDELGQLLLADNTEKEQIYAWWEQLRSDKQRQANELSELQISLFQLWDMVTRFMEECLAARYHKNEEQVLLDEFFQASSENKVLFDVLVARILYVNMEAYIYTNPEQKTYGYNYDKKNEIQYYTPYTCYIDYSVFETFTHTPFSDQNVFELSGNTLPKLDDELPFPMEVSNEK